MGEGKELHLRQGSNVFGQMLGVFIPAATRKIRAWEIPAKIVSEGSLLSSPQGCYFPLIHRAQEGAGIFWCKTRKSLRGNKLRAEVATQ